MIFYNPFKKLSKFEWLLWMGSMCVVAASFILSEGGNLLTLLASLFGVTALIFVAKGDVWGQILTVVFSILYGIISFQFRYYGEMITYLGMTMPIAIMSVYTWLKYPYQGTGEVKVHKLRRKQVEMLAIITVLVTFAFYFILKAFGTANLFFSTISIATSFLASTLMMLRNQYYAVAYACNDIVLIILWVLATLDNISYLPMVLCFVMFLVNDVYGFWSWEKMKKRQQKKKYVTMLLVLMVFGCLMQNYPVSADTGPKPSVVIAFHGMEQKEYYATLISREGSGPWNQECEYGYEGANKEVWEKLQEYTDAEGYAFIGYYEDCTETNTLEWTYYPPEEFKILIYLPETDTFLVSKESYERYAFDSYFTAEVSLLTDIHVEKSYDYTKEIYSLICRILLTIAVELLIAVLWGFRTKRQIGIIGITNVVTQVILNILLNLINYRGGTGAFIFHYIWMEILVFVLEGVIFSKLLRSDTEKKKSYIWLYALVANAASFGVGIGLAKVLTGIF